MTQPRYTVELKAVLKSPAAQKHLVHEILEILRNIESNVDLWHSSLLIVLGTPQEEVKGQ